MRRSVEAAGARVDARSGHKPFREQRRRVKVEKTHAVIATLGRSRAVLPRLRSFAIDS
jgi:hypothetical protein